MKKTWTDWWNWRKGKDFRGFLFVCCFKIPTHTHLDTNDYSYVTDIFLKGQKGKRVEVIQLIKDSIGIWHKHFQIMIPIVFSLDCMTFFCGQIDSISLGCSFFIIWSSTIALTFKGCISSWSLTAFEVRLIPLKGQAVGWQCIWQLPCFDLLYMFSQVLRSF